jgi:hypothetical protein
MSEQAPIYPAASSEFAEERKRLAPRTAEAFKAFSQSMERRLSKLWKRFGSLLRCAQGPLRRIRCWPWR